jgi:hypothetical protein
MNFTRAQGVFTSITQQETGDLVIKPTTSLTIDGTIDTLLPDNTENVVNFKEAQTASSYLRIDTLNGNEYVKFGTTPKIAFGNYTTASSINDAAATFSGGVGISQNLYVGTNLAVHGNSTLTGNLTVDGILTSAVFRTALHIENGIIVLGDVPGVLISASGTVGSITGTGPWSATITGLSNTTGLIPGTLIVAIDGVGRLGGETCVITSVSTYSITYTATGTVSPIEGGISNISVSGATDVSADGCGIVLKGSTDKTISWISDTNRWTYDVAIESVGIEKTPVGELVPSTGKFTKLVATDSLVVPVGSGATRPSPAAIGDIRFNTYSSEYEGYYGSAWRAIRAGLNPTPIRNSITTATANQLIVADSSTGGFIIELPSALSDGDTISVLDGSNSFGTNPVVLKATGMTTIENSDSLVLNVTGSQVTIVYDIGSSNWVLQYIPFGYIGSPSVLTETSIKTSLYTAVSNDLVRIDASSGAFNITLPDSPINGTTIGIIDATGSLGLHSVTLVPHAGNTIYGESSLILDVAGTYLTVVYNSGDWVINYNPIGFVGNPSALGLTTTPIATTNVSTAANQLVRVDARANTVAVTLPLNPVDGSIVGIADCFGWSGVYPINILPNTGDTIIATDSMLIDVKGAVVMLIYNLASNNWNLQSIPGNTSANGLTSIASSTTVVANSFDLLRVDTTIGPLSISFPILPLNGDIIGLFDMGNKFSVNPVTLVAGDSTTIDGTSTVTIADSGSYSEYLYDDSTLNWKLTTPVISNKTYTPILSGTGSINVDIDFAVQRGKTIILNLPSGVNGATVNFTKLSSKAYIGSVYSFDVIVSHISSLSNSTAIVFKYNNTSFPMWASGSIPGSTVAAGALDTWSFFTYDGGITLIGKQNLSDIR